MAQQSAFSLPQGRAVLGLLVALESSLSLNLHGRDRGPASDIASRLVPGSFTHMTAHGSAFDRQIYLSPCHGDMLGWLRRSCAIDTWLSEVRVPHPSD